MTFKIFFWTFFLFSCSRTLHNYQNFVESRAPQTFWAESVLVSSSSFRHAIHKPIPPSPAVTQESSQSCIFHLHSVHQGGVATHVIMLNLKYLQQQSLQFAKFRFCQKNNSHKELKIFHMILSNSFQLFCFDKFLSIKLWCKVSISIATRRTTCAVPWSWLRRRQKNVHMTSKKLSTYLATLLSPFPSFSNPLGTCMSFCPGKSNLDAETKKTKNYFFLSPQHTHNSLLIV